MKLGDLSELHLAAIVAGATALGGILSSAAEWALIDAGTERQTDVQLVQLAIGILSEANPDGQGAPTLRAWAVETINAVAEVKFDEDAQRQLVEGTAELPLMLPENLNEIIERHFGSALIWYEIDGQRFQVQNDPSPQPVDE